MRDENSPLLDTGLFLVVFGLVSYLTLTYLAERAGIFNVQEGSFNVIQMLCAGGAIFITTMGTILSLIGTTLIFLYRAKVVNSKKTNFVEIGIVIVLSIALMLAVKFLQRSQDEKESQSVKLKIAQQQVNIK